MEKKALVVSAVVGFLGIASAALAFAAEGTRIKSSDVSLVDECKYPKSASVGLGLVSALLLLIAQIILNAVTGCYCCVRNQNYPSSNRMTGLISFVLSWVTFVFAFLMLLGGAAVNNQRYDGGNSRYFYYNKCYVLKPGVFAGAGILVLATAALGIICYISLSSMWKNTGPWGTQNPGIAMGQPQFPAQSNQPGHWAPQQHQGPAMSNNQPPVFVHEDTYRRQQYP